MRDEIESNQIRCTEAEDLSLNRPSPNWICEVPGGEPGEYISGDEVDFFGMKKVGTLGATEIEGKPTSESPYILEKVNAKHLGKDRDDYHSYFTGWVGRGEKDEKVVCEKNNINGLRQISCQTEDKY